MLILPGVSIKGPARTQSRSDWPAKDRPATIMWGGRLRIRRLLVWTIAVVVAGTAGFAVFAHQPEISAVARPDPASFDKALVERGRVLANYGDCTACHTRPDGPPFAGNFPLKTPFGTIYTSNITPDAETGIGAWSKEAFRRSMKDGVNRMGHHLYPAFPYDHFTKVKDADIDAIYAYLMASVEPVRETARGNNFGFPFNIRATLAVWKALFLDRTPFQHDPSKDVEWNEGAYLVEGLGHCAACHSPRNIMGARTTPAYGGGSAEGWYAPPLNKDNLSQQPWTKVELVTYLMDGWHPKHGMAAGPMTPVVDALHKQNEIDVFAIAAYVGTLRAGEKPIDDAVRTAALKLEWGHPEAPPVPPPFGDGAKVFAARCAQCHRSGGATVPLALQTSIQAPVPDSVVQVIQDGIKPPVGALGRSMPAFGPQLSQAEITALVGFLRARFSTRASWKM
jgi:mono/diheme cytochrome c family protein